jgi:hypothetical protein
MTSFPFISETIRGFSTKVGPSPSGSGSASMLRLRLALLSPKSFFTLHLYVPPSGPAGS